MVKFVVSIYEAGFSHSHSHVSEGMLSDLPTKIAMKLSGLNKHEAKAIGVKCGISQLFATPKTRRIKVGLAIVNLNPLFTFLIYVPTSPGHYQQELFYLWVLLFGISYEISVAPPEPIQI